MTCLNGEDNVNDNGQISINSSHSHAINTFKILKINSHEIKGTSHFVFLINQL